MFTEEQLKEFDRRMNEMTDEEWVELLLEATDSGIPDEVAEYLCSDAHFIDVLGESKFRQLKQEIVNGEY